MHELEIRAEDDAIVVQHAIREKRTLITNDSDFFSERESDYGIILLWGKIDADGGLSRQKPFRNLKKKDKRMAVFALFQNYSRELQR